MKPSDCAILVPIGSHLEPETEAGLQVLHERGYQIHSIRGTADVVLARCDLATKALKDGYKETLWIDSDIVFDPDDVEKIRQRGPFVAGLYMRKKKGTGLACKFKDDKGVWFGANGGLVEMQYVGMGFTYVRREVYEAIGLPEYEGGYEGRKVRPYFLPLLADEGRGTLCYLAEDYAFSERARQAGFPPMADTTIRLGHMGRYNYTWEVEDVTQEQLFAKLGKLTAENDDRKDQYTTLINLLAAVVNGTIDRSRVAVNVTDQTWSYVGLGERASRPATINGLPCVHVSDDPTVQEMKDEIAALKKKYEVIDEEEGIEKEANGVLSL